MAIDGKHLATLAWHDLVRLTRLVRRRQHKQNPQLSPLPEFDIDDREPFWFEVESVFKVYFPQVQLCKPDTGKPYGLIRVHRATLISSEAAVCIHQNALPGDSNEVGTIDLTLFRLLEDYKHTSLPQLVTMDAGNTCISAANRLVSAQCQYFLAIKTNNGQIYSKAKELLGGEDGDNRRPDAVVYDKREGKMVIYNVWHERLPEQVGQWKHAHQVVRVERLTVGDDEGDVNVGNRYFVSSLSPTQLDANACLTLCRMHWRCENEGHWTSDVMWQEDAKRTLLSRNPDGVVVGSWLRMMAQNITALLRVLSKEGDSKARPSWRTVVEHVLLVLYQPILDTHRFDAVQD